MRIEKQRNPKACVTMIILCSLFVFACKEPAPVQAQTQVQPNTHTASNSSVSSLYPITAFEQTHNTGWNKKYLSLSNPVLRMEYPEYHSFIYRYIPLREEQLKMLKECIVKYGLQVNMQSSSSLNSVGYGLYERKQYGEAVRFFREAAYLDPTNVYAHYNLACTLSLLRDSIWADPKADMNYFRPFQNRDLYVEKYNLYIQTYDPNISDETCRDEIYDHLTLAALQSSRYVEKAPVDSDLKGIHNHLRFKRLMNNLKDNQVKEIYGVYYVPNSDTKATFFMLDGRVRQILVNNEVGHIFYFGANDDIIESEKKEYIFDKLVTGYEYFVDFDGPYGVLMPLQWEYDPPMIDLYTLRMETDKKYFPPYDEPFTPRTFDFTYFKDKIKPHDVTANSFSFYDIDSNNVKFINIYKYPYRGILYEDEETISAYLDFDPSTEITELATVALIYDRYEILDWLIQNYPDTRLDDLMLTACMYNKIDFFKKLEAGEYGFSMESFITNKGAEMLLHTAASGNASFFESLYKEYHNKLSGQQIYYVKEEIVSWTYITEVQKMFDITRKIRDGKYYVE